MVKINWSGLQLYFLVYQLFKSEIDIKKGLWWINILNMNSLFLRVDDEYIVELLTHYFWGFMLDQEKNLIFKYIKVSFQNQFIF